jgi:cysteinyl-tRNA synthetase, unknown class
MSSVDWKSIGFGACAVIAASWPLGIAIARSNTDNATALPVSNVPAPVPAKRPPRAVSNVHSPIQAQAERLARITGAKSWGYQLHGMSVDEAANSPYDLLVVDATTGLASGKPFTKAEVERMKRKPDGSRRIVVSYLSVGESEDYRPDYFTPEYMTEDAPDWLLHENKDWKGNRLIRFCHNGWQMTILGDEYGRNVYNSVEYSPLYRLIDKGFDGIYLDRVDVYHEVTKECPDGARKMVDFIARLGAHARKRDPHFMVILQNAEELLDNRIMVDTIDAVAKEGLFHSWSGDSGDNAYSVKQLKKAQAAGRGVFVVDYTSNRSKADMSVRKIQAQGFVPYIGPKELNKLWLPGKNF